MEAREARFFARLSLLCSRCSLIRSARSFWYSAASVLAFATLCFLIATLWRFLCKVRGVTNLWILGALLLFLPEKREKQRKYINFLLLPNHLKPAAMFPDTYMNSPMKMRWKFVKTTLTCSRDKCAAVRVHIFPHIIILGEVKELANLGCSFRTPHPWLLSIGEAGKVIVTWTLHMPIISRNDELIYKTVHVPYRANMISDFPTCPHWCSL